MLKMHIMFIYLYETLSIKSIFFSATCLFYGGYYIIWNCTIYYSYSILLVTIDVWCKFYVKSQKSRQLSEGMHTVQTLCICLFTILLRGIHNCKKNEKKYFLKTHVCKNQNACALRHGFNTMYHGIIVALEFEQNELRAVGLVFCKYLP